MEEYDIPRGTAVFMYFVQSIQTILFDVLHLDNDMTQQIVSWEALQYHRGGVVEGTSFSSSAGVLSGPHRIPVCHGTHCVRRLDHQACSSQYHHTFRWSMTAQSRIGDLLLSRAKGVEPLVCNNMNLSGRWLPSSSRVYCERLNISPSTSMAFRCSWKPACLTPSSWTCASSLYTTKLRARLSEECLGCLLTSLNPRELFSPRRRPLSFHAAYTTWTCPIETVS